MKITTLVENTVTAGLLPLTSEHGLSFYIRTGDRRILFDTGQGATLLNNADLLEIDLSRVDTVVLSHGHFDHAGGLEKLMQRNQSFTLVGHPDNFYDKQVKRNGRYYAIGMLREKALLEQFNIAMRLEKEPTEIAPGIMTTGRIPMETAYEAVEPGFFVKEGGDIKPDTIKDDRALILDTPKGIVVVLGCAHRGIINILNHVNTITGNKKIHAIMGGLHLLNADVGKLQMVFNALGEFDIDRIIVGHCTGFNATAALVNTFGDKIVPNTVGSVFEF